MPKNNFGNTETSTRSIQQLTRRTDESNPV